ncbi:hypothetical protein IQ265_11640 [Nodosilinea sp. LEGE 06152]|uniref:hypothetical protein n=1 Tax=Nodosilinea sp. LEGE 06152 TaxID=2777966 RepID=UPI00187ECA33|nr:hypothetical protein [Nodosilinea sp. LEGE 06152]MBE9157470.1 hypothetical protein [Nodosilinea sp. LEGE 06152]
MSDIIQEMPEKHVRAIQYKNKEIRKQSYVIAGLVLFSLWMILLCQRSSVDTASSDAPASPQYGAQEYHRGHSTRSVGTIKDKPLIALHQTIAID